MLTAALAPARTLDAAAIRDDFPLLARSTSDARPSSTWTAPPAPRSRPP
jgi:hypothetical protein